MNTNISRCGEIMKDFRNHLEAREILDQATECVRIPGEFDITKDLALPINAPFFAMTKAVQEWEHKTEGKVFLIGTPIGPNPFFDEFKSIKEPEEEIYIEF